MAKAFNFPLVVVLVVAFVCNPVSPSSTESPLPETILIQLFPELKKPKLMTLQDLPNEDERIGFKDYGFSFQITGDFNRDNIPDRAIAGRFENPDSANDMTFVAILTKRKGQWQKEFFYRPKSRIVVLKLVPHPDRNKAKKGYRAVLAQFTGMPSDDYIVIYWDGKRYRVFSGFDTERWKGYFR